MNSETLNGATLGLIGATTSVPADPTTSPTGDPTPIPVVRPIGTPSAPGDWPSLNGEPLNDSVLAVPGAPTQTDGMIDPVYVDLTYVDFEYLAIVPTPTPVPGLGYQLFREALEARLLSSTALEALVGDNIFYAVLPQKHDLGRDGPALTFMVVGRPMGHVLTGSDGTATARVQFSAWAYRERTADLITEAVRNLFDGSPQAWGDNTVKIMSVVQEDEIDLPEEPRAGSDQWTYQIASDYSIKHRVSIPTLS